MNEILFVRSFYVCYLTCGFIASTHAFNLPARAFNLLTRVFSLSTRAFNVATRSFSLLIREFEIATRGFELVTCRFELGTRISELATFQVFVSIIDSRFPLFWFHSTLSSVSMTKLKFGF